MVLLRFFPGQLQFIKLQYRNKFDLQLHFATVLQIPWNGKFFSESHDMGWDRPSTPMVQFGRPTPFHQEPSNIL